MILYIFLFINYIHRYMHYNNYIIVHRQRAYFHREQIDILDDFCTTQSYYPTMEQYQELVDQTGMARKQIIVGFRTSMKIILVLKTIYFNIPFSILHNFLLNFKKLSQNSIKYSKKKFKIK